MPKIALAISSCLMICLAASLADAAERPLVAKTQETRAAVSGKPHPSELTPTQIRSAADQIDKLVEADLKRHNIRPNAPIDDATFLRRLYLDATGRIPSHDEAKSFLDDKAKDKRANLIDQLIGSEGYVSHQFNFWADILRIQSRMTGGSTGNTYIDWVKQSIRDNKPYDQFVRELLTASGHIYDNGPSGYYMRDDGMPLDNMANTVQIFLGTQLACAQCHDHPFDKWTQHEFYEMAAYTYGVQTRAKPSNEERGKYRELQKLTTSRDVDNQTKQILRNLTRRMRYEVSEDPRRMAKLPKEYQYDDAKPGSVVEPMTLFGKAPEIKPGDSRRESYAQWMTSSDNPRFTTVIVNRLWKQAFGRAMVEPIDDIRDDTVASNPELMKYLEALMKRLDCNQQQFLRVVYHTKTYQREATAVEVDLAEPYHFQGPLLRRMTAEQLWDSMLTLALPEPDLRQGRKITSPYDGKNRLEELRDKDAQQILAMAKEIADNQREAPNRARQYRELQAQMKDALRKRDAKEIAKIRGQIEALRDKSNFRSESDPADDSRWNGYGRELVRASEVTQPAPAGHFLQQFGQSDREVIDGGNTEATVTQVLTLLNGPIYRQLGSANAVLRQSIEKAGTPDQKIDAIFLGTLARYPSAEERSLIKTELATDAKEGFGNVVWALLNTRSFAFVQ